MQHQQSHEIMFNHFIGLGLQFDSQCVNSSVFNFFGLDFIYKFILVSNFLSFRNLYPALFLFIFKQHYNKNSLHQYFRLHENAPLYKALFKEMLVHSFPLYAPHSPVTQVFSPQFTDQARGLTRYTYSPSEHIQEVTGPDANQGLCQSLELFPGNFSFLAIGLYFTRSAEVLFVGCQMSHPRTMIFRLKNLTNNASEKAYFGKPGKAVSIQIRFIIKVSNTKKKNDLNPIVPHVLF